MASGLCCFPTVVFPILDEIPSAAESRPHPHQSSVASLTCPDAGQGDLRRRFATGSRRTVGGGGLGGVPSLGLENNKREAIRK